MHDGAVRRHPALAVSLVAATLLLLGAFGTLAGPFITGALVQVSGTSPFAGCTADDVAGQIARDPTGQRRSEEHTSELQSLAYLVCRLLLEKKKKTERT